MKPILTCLAVLWTALAVPAAAQNNPVVVELFTSQGCSSCPPADAMLHDLAKRDDVIALALHVDYWDYIGWKDVFASPANTERQKGYAVVAGRRSIYTPQMIVNGADAIMGAKGMELAEQISAHAAQPVKVAVALNRAGDRLTIRATLVDAAARDAMLVQMVRFTPERSISITRGENAGRDMSYANVVHAFDIVAEWDGQEPLDMTTPITGDDPVAVLVQYAGHGQIVGAALLD